MASYAGRRPERFDTWRDNIGALAKSPNVSVKLGGLAMPFNNFPSFMSEPAAPSTKQKARTCRPFRASGLMS